MGSVEGDELRHDQSFSEKQLEPYKQEALDLLIDRLFEGKSVGGLHLDAYVEKFAEEIAADIIIDGQSSAGMLQHRIRAELSDSDAVRERAAELAQEE